MSLGIEGKGPPGPLTPPLERIVVGVDFSEGSLAAAGWVGRHLAPQAHLVLVHVAAALRVERGQWRGVPGGEPSPGAPRLSMRGALRGLGSLLGSARVTVESRAGDPAVELARVAAARDADMIVVGSGAGTDGSLVARLLQRAARPVLVAREVHTGVPATVLAAVADDADAVAVLRAAWRLARSCNAAVSALQVVPRAPSSTIVAHDDLAREALAAAQETRAGIVAIGVPIGVPIGASADNGATAAPRLRGNRSTWRDLVSGAPCSILLVPQPAGEPGPRFPLRVPGGRARHRDGARTAWLRTDGGTPPAPAAARRTGGDAA